MQAFDATPFGLKGVPDEVGDPPAQVVKAVATAKRLELGNEIAALVVAEHERNELRTTELEFQLSQSWKIERFRRCLQRQTPWKARFSRGLSPPKLGGRTRTRTLCPLIKSK